ncbi:MAG TPA: hypothetical protein VGQ81_00605 [Acidobacteriota bacterium]|nr:hypothetical protein [Acidobacteriota bacterium]
MFRLRIADFGLRVVLKALGIIFWPEVFQSDSEVGKQSAIEVIRNPQSAIRTIGNLWRFNNG